MCDVPERGCVVEHRPRTLRYRFATKVIFDEPACEHALVLRCQPREGEGLTILKGAVCIEPEVPLQAQRDSFGNALAVCRIAEAHDYVLYVSEGIVRIDLGETGPCVAHPLYRYPSALATASDEMCDWLRAQGLVSGLWEDDPDLAYEHVADLCHAVSKEMTYAPGSTNITTTASEAFALHCGVCQDYAHIVVALLRYLGIAARYVLGLAVGEGCTHAWVQAHLGGRWRGFDPTRDTCVDETYIPLAVGRDWSDCPVERGGFMGAPGQCQDVHMEVLELGGCS